MKRQNAWNIEEGRCPEIRRALTVCAQAWMHGHTQKTKVCTHVHVCGFMWACIYKHSYLLYLLPSFSPLRNLIPFDLFVLELHLNWPSTLPPIRSSIPLSLHPSIHLVQLSPPGQLSAWTRLAPGRPYNRPGQPCVRRRSLFALCLPTSVGGRTLLFLITTVTVKWKDLWASKLNQSN